MPPTLQNILGLALAGLDPSSIAVQLGVSADWLGHVLNSDAYKAMAGTAVGGGPGTLSGMP